MTNEAWPPSLLRVLDDPEQTRLADISGLLMRQIADLTETELGDLLEFRRTMAHERPDSPRQWRTPGATSGGSMSARPTS